MRKRQFLSAAALAGGALPTFAHAAARPGQNPGPALLTLTGAIGKVNRGRFDPVFDQMMEKQKITFEKAHAFDFAALTSLPSLHINAMLEDGGKVRALRGPTLVDVLKAAGAAMAEDNKLVLRAVDGYAATLTLAQARAQRFIVATHLDGQPMALGGLGPLWAIYDAERAPELAARPLPERFANCPWALYHVEVQA